MACPSCGTTVLFGGVKEGKKRYCSKQCHSDDVVFRLAETIPADQVDALAAEIHSGDCPKCGSDGPVDVHRSYSIYSLIYISSWRTKEHVVCKKCATKKQVTGLISSFFLGWWGVPFGLLMTPVMLVSNIAALFKNPGLNGPSEALRQSASVILANQQLHGVQPEVAGDVLDPDDPIERVHAMA